MSLSLSTESCASSVKEGCNVLPNLRFLADDIAEIFTGDSNGTVEIIEMKNYVLPNVSAAPLCVFQCTEDNSDEYITCAEFPGNFPYFLTGNNKGELFVFRERLNCPHPFIEKRRIFTSSESEPLFMIRSNQLDAGFVCAAYADAHKDKLVVLDLLRQGHMEQSVPLVDFSTTEELVDATWTWKHPALLVVSSTEALRVIDIRCATECPKSLFFKASARMLRASQFKPDIFSTVVGNEIHLFDIRKLACPLVTYPVQPELEDYPIDMMKWHPRLPHELLYSSTLAPFIARQDTSDCTTVTKVKAKDELPKSEIMSWDRTWDFAETDQSFVDMIVERRNDLFPVVEGRVGIPGYGAQYDICRQDDSQEMPLLLNPPRGAVDSDSNSSLGLPNFSGIDDDSSCSFPGDDRPRSIRYRSTEKGNPKIKEVKMYSFVSGAGIHAKSNSKEMQRRASLQSVFSEPIPIQPNKYYQKYVQISENAAVFKTKVVTSQTEDDPVVYETTDRTASPVISSSMNPGRLPDNSPEVKALREEKKRCVYWDPMKALRSLAVPEEVMNEAARELNSIIPPGTAMSVEAVNSLATVAISKLRAIYKSHSTLTATPSKMGIDCVTGYRLKAIPQSFAVPGYGLSGVAFLHWGPTSRIQFVESLMSENEEKVPVEFILTIEDMRLHELYKITRPGDFNMFELRLRSRNTHPKNMGLIESLEYMQSDDDPWFLLWAVGSAHYYEAPIRNRPLLERLRPSTVEQPPELPSLKEFLETLPPPKIWLPPPRREGIDASMSIGEAVIMLQKEEKEREQMEEDALAAGEAIKAAALEAKAMSISSSVETPSPPSSMSSCSPVYSHPPLKSSLSRAPLDVDGWKKHRRVTFAMVPPKEFDPNPMPEFCKDKTDRNLPVTIDSKETLPTFCVMKPVPPPPPPPKNKKRKKKAPPPRKPRKREKRKYTLCRSLRFKKEQRIHKHMDLEMKGFPGLLQLVDTDIRMKATEVAYFDCTCMEHVTYYTSPYRVRMLIAFRLAQHDNITRMLRPDADTVHDHLEVLLCSLLHGKFFVFTQVLEEIAMKYAIPNTIGKVYSRHAQFFLDLVKLIRTFVHFVTVSRPKAMADPLTHYADISEPILELFDEFMAKEHELLHKNYILVLPCLWILRMETHSKKHLEIMKDKVLVMKRLPFHLRLLFLVRTCPTNDLRSCLLQMFQNTKGMDRLIYVGLGRHSDCLSVLADHLHATQDYQMIAHLLIAGRVLEEDENFLDVVDEIVRDKAQIIKLEPIPPKEPPKLYDFKASLPPTSLPPPPPKEPSFEEVFDERDLLRRDMFLSASGMTREQLIQMYLVDEDGKRKIYKYLKHQGRLPPHKHMHQVYHNKYIPGIVPRETLLAIARLAACRYFTYLQLVDGLVHKSLPRIIDPKEELPKTFRNGGLFKYYLMKLSGAGFHRNLEEDETFCETRCTYCGATRNNAERPAPDEEQQQQINKNKVIKDRADRRRAAMQEAAEENRENAAEGDPDSFVPHEDINGSMATTEEEMYAPPPYACPQCRKPGGRCSICHRMERTDFSELSEVDHTSLQFVICKLCHHGGHMEHMKDWFCRFTECPVAECVCKCFRLPKGEDVRMWMEEDMGFHPDATFEF